MKLSEAKKLNEVFRRRRNAMKEVGVEKAGGSVLRPRRRQWKPWCLAPLSLHKIQEHVTTILKQMPSKHHLHFEDFLDELEYCLSVPQGSCRPHEEQLWPMLCESARRLDRNFECVEYTEGEEVPAHSLSRKS